ncbi:EID1-like F-box protein 2 [Sesamum angolense]|uniref:EID1-like F-box protein 2 n=1 Tax=Sesamum angolense TaxID=2727404 RepID=A0AAE1XDI6_9LAMI|nr:EID1-like F-box protein 2 [Sesamum angolense]
MEVRHATNTCLVDSMGIAEIYKHEIEMLNINLFLLPGEKMILTKQYRCIHSASCVCTKGHLTEEIIFLVFNHLNWNPKLIAALSCSCKWFDDLAKRVLWKEFCKTRAPKMMLDLQSSGSHSVDGNWRALDQGDEGDIGFFRGIFKSFATSKVRKMLIKRSAPLHPTEVCPYCKAKLWNMLAAKMIPSSASCRLGAYEDCIEYYVCLNGHVLGICTLLPLSDTDEASEE